jgi:DNA-binding HxlR family transcriptional regulator
VRRKSFEEMACSVAQCLEAVGEWWTMLIVRDAFFGVSRFDEFQQRLGIGRNVLTQRLATLVEHGILERVAYQDHPVRYDYRLTAKGRDLWLVLTAMRQWGDRWAAPAGPPVRLVHETCGRIASVRPVCSVCGEPMSARNVGVKSGPGADQSSPVLPAPGRGAREPGRGAATTGSRSRGRG